MKTSICFSFNRST